MAINLTVTIIIGLLVAAYCLTLHFLLVLRDNIYFDELSNEAPILRSQNEEENQYLQHQLNDIIDKGYEEDDRTGVGTISLFGTHMRFNLENNSFPLLTTKKMFMKGIIEELLWFIRGSTNRKNLEFNMEGEFKQGSIR